MIKQYADWTLLHPQMTFEDLGYLPQIILKDDPRPVVEQVNERYMHGGGWQKFEGFKLGLDNSLQYPGDPSFKPLAYLKLNNGEEVFIYPYSWVRVVYTDETWEVARMD